MRARNNVYLAGVVALAMLWGTQAALADSTMHARISYESGGAMERWAAGDGGGCALDVRGGFGPETSDGAA